VVNSQSESSISNTITDSPEKRGYDITQDVEAQAMAACAGALAVSSRKVLASKNE
jgi:hypothetical protein